MSAESDAAPNRKFATIKVPVPRNPEAYARSDHFRQRQRYRSDPEIKPWIVEECIREGELKGVDDLETPGPDDDDQIGCFAFHKEVWSEGRHEWRIVVGLSRSAYLEPDRHHAIVTAYCHCHGDATDGRCPSE